MVRIRAQTVHILRVKHPITDELEEESALISGQTINQAISEDVTLWDLDTISIHTSDNSTSTDEEAELVTRYIKCFK